MVSTKKYQPDRPDIFINSNWGIPKESLSEERATERGLTLYEDRWVTKAERELLKRQKRAYVAIKILSCFMIALAALIVLPALAITCWGFGWGSPPNWSIIEAAVVLSVCAITPIIAIGLWRLKKWAWRIAKLLFVYLPAAYVIPIIVMFPPGITTFWICVYVIVILSNAPILLNKITKNIFGIAHIGREPSPFKWYATIYGKMMIISPVCVLTVFAIVLILGSEVRHYRDEEARHAMRSLSAALLKLENELVAHNCPNPKEVLEGLTEDQLNYLVNYYYHWLGSRSHEFRYNVLIRKRGHEISACSEYGSFPSILDRDRRYISRLRTIDTAELPTITGKCEGRIYRGAYPFYNGSVLHDDDIRRGLFIIKEPQTRR